MLVEEFEEVIEDWYRNHQEEDLTQFLCANHVLKGKDTSESEEGEGSVGHASILLFAPPQGRWVGRGQGRNRGCRRLSVLGS